MGFGDVRENFIVVSNGKLDRDGHPVLVLVKKSAFTRDEVIGCRQLLYAGGNLQELYSPWFRQDNDVIVPEDLIWARPDWYTFGELIESPQPAGFVAHYPYDISPVHDDAPFFFFTFKTSQLFHQILHPGEQGIDWKVNLGVAVLFMLLTISLLAVAAFLILPLAFHAPARGIKILPLFYFVAVGLGYILVEITFIQRLVLFLGHPTYALTVVVFLLLLSSGAGSLAARRWMGAPGWSQRVLLPLLLIVSALALYIPLLPRLLSAEVGLPFVAKLLISAALLAPLGFAMGMPFPTGLRALERIGSSSVEWAWAMNAASSVLGSVLAIVIAVHFGLAATLACGAGAYLAAALLTRSFQPQALTT